MSESRFAIDESEYEAVELRQLALDDLSLRLRKTQVFQYAFEFQWPGLDALDGVYELIVASNVNIFTRRQHCIEFMDLFFSKSTKADLTNTYTMAYLMSQYLFSVTKNAGIIRNIDIHGPIFDSYMGTEPYRLHAWSTIQNQMSNFIDLRRAANFEMFRNFQYNPYAKSKRSIEVFGRYYASYDTSFCDDQILIELLVATKDLALAELQRKAKQNKDNVSVEYFKAKLWVFFAEEELAGGYCMSGRYALLLAFKLFHLSPRVFIRNLEYCAAYREKITYVEDMLASKNTHVLAINKFLNKNFHRMRENLNPMRERSLEEIVTGIDDPIIYDYVKFVEFPKN